MPDSRSVLAKVRAAKVVYWVAVMSPPCSGYVTAWGAVLITLAPAGIFAVPGSAAERAAESGTGGVSSSTTPEVGAVTKRPAPFQAVTYVVYVSPGMRGMSRSMAE